MLSSSHTTGRYETSLWIISNSPRTRKKVIKIQAAFRGYLCRKRFNNSLLQSFYEELDEAEEWSRSEIESLEEEKFTQLKSMWRSFNTVSFSMKKMMQTPTAAPPTTNSTQPRPTTNHTTANRVVSMFCTNMEKMLSELFDNDLCRELLPTNWKDNLSRSNDDNEVFHNLFCIYDCLQHLLPGISNVFKTLLLSDPVSQYQDMKPLCDDLGKVQASLHERIDDIEQRLSALPSANAPTSDPASSVSYAQRMTELELCLQREKELKEEVVLLRSVLDVPGMVLSGVQRPAHRFFAPGGKRRGGRGSRPGSAEYLATTNSSCNSPHVTHFPSPPAHTVLATIPGYGGNNSPTVSSSGLNSSVSSLNGGVATPTVRETVAHCHRWTHGCLSALVDRCEILSTKRQAVVGKAEALIRGLEQTARATCTDPNVLSRLGQSPPPQHALVTNINNSNNSNNVYNITTLHHHHHYHATGLGGVPAASKELRSLSSSIPSCPPHTPIHQAIAKLHDCSLDSPDCHHRPVTPPEVHFGPAPALFTTVASAAALARTGSQSSATGGSLRPAMGSTAGRPDSAALVDNGFILPGVPISRPSSTGSTESQLVRCDSVRKSPRCSLSPLKFAPKTKEESPCSLLISSVDSSLSTLVATKLKPQPASHNPKKNTVLSGIRRDVALQK